MDKITLLTELRAIQKSMNASIDRMMEKVMAMDDGDPATGPAPQAVRVEGVFNTKTAMRYLGVSSTKFWGGIREGIIPPGDYSLGPRSPRWFQSDLDACLKRRKEERHDTEKKSGRKARSVPAARQGV